MVFASTRAVVVGVGFVGVAHIEALRRLGVEVAGVVGSSPQRARAKAERAGLPRVYEDLAEALADDSIDVIHIATPNHLHVVQATAALAAGKHVVCEKPLGVSTAETAAMVAAADQSGLVNAVCFNLRFYPSCHQAAAMVARGDVGTPRFVTGSYLQDWLLLPTDWNWRLAPAQAGELRAVADIGSHWLDLAQFVTGRRIVEVMADLHTLVPVRRHPAGPVEKFAAAGSDETLIEEEMTSDDAASIMLRFEDGARGLVAVSQVAAGHKNSLTIEVDGSAAALAWLSEEPDRLWIGHRGRPNEVLHRDPTMAAPEAARLMAYPAGHVEGYADTFRALFQQVYGDVVKGAPSPHPTYPTFADGDDAVRVTDAVTRSSAQRRWVPVHRGGTTT
ncbi:MAG: Gfo/Idh/MocA family oxidoreductase [Acidimicrobiia bacterium]|nr:Gfo/Idh/MocA family oxidoreductase [Acidimicrobiia bacterium]